MAFNEEIGKDGLLKRAVLAAAPSFERGLVYVGFPWRVDCVDPRPGRRQARGLPLLHGTSDIAESASVDELPVQLHVAEPDQFETDDWLSA